MDWRRLVHGRDPHRRARLGRIVADERGQAMFFTLLFMPLLMVLALLGMSIATMLGARASAQRAADAAALAACFDLPVTTNVQADASKYGASSGNLNASTAANLDSGDGGQTATATVSTSGAKGAAGATLANDKVTVNVSRNQPLIGTSSYGFASQSIKATAVCQRQEGGLPVLLSLAPTGKHTFKTVGNITYNLGTGGIVADSSDTSGAMCSASDTINAAYISTPSGQTQNCGGLGAPVTVGFVPDPFCPSYPANTNIALCTSVPEPAQPSASAVEATGCPATITASKPKMCTVTSGAVAPGVFWGGLTLGDGSARTVTLTQGTYYLAGGGLQVQANTTVTGSGVMFFSGAPSGKAGQNVCSDSAIAQDATYSVSPPQSGTYKGLLFFQSRACTNTLTVDVGTTVGLPPTGSPAQPCGGLVCGVLYLQQGTLDMGPQKQGNSGNINGLNALLVADNMFIHGPISFNNLSFPSGVVNHGTFGLTQ